MNQKSKISLNQESREGDLLTVPSKQQNQADDRILTPPPSPEKLQHDAFWRETVLFWNRSDYRWSLVEYIPCLMGIIWEEERMGAIEQLASFPLEAQYYFIKGVDANNFALDNLNYRKLFRSKISLNAGNHHIRRKSEPDFTGSRHVDPEGITNDSFLFNRFLRQVLKTTKISCTVLILSLKFAQHFLHRIRSTPKRCLAGLESNQFRLFVTSLLLADKYSEDHPYTNKSWASLSGLPVEDINIMERSFLDTIGHELYLSEAEFRNWTKSLQNLCQWNTPNPHHPKNSRLLNISLNNSLRRMSFSNTNENNSTSSSNSSISISHHEAEKVSFWNRFRFNHK